MTVSHDRGKSIFYDAPDGLRLHLRDYNPGPTSRFPVVCLSGLTRNGDDFGPLAAALAFESATPRRVIAMDYRGRGASAYAADWKHYDIATERGDCLAGLATLGITRAHMIGTSRGGLHIMAMAAEHRALIQSAVLNDIGPVLEPEGLARIKGYIGTPSRPRDYAQAIEFMKAGSARNFDGLSEKDWLFFAAAVYGLDEANLNLRYDPALAHTLDGFDLAKPLPDLWPQFDALNGLPLLAIRGANSDLLSAETHAAMRARWLGCEAIEIEGQAHAPLLADAHSIHTIDAFLAAAD